MDTKMNISSSKVLYKEGPDSFVSHNGQTFMVDHLLDLVKDVEYPSLIKTTDLIWVLSETKVDPVRVDNADTKIPLIVLHERSGRYVVLDGVHRLTKLARYHTLFVRCYVIEEEVLGKGSI